MDLLRLNSQAPPGDAATWAQGDDRPAWAVVLKAMAVKNAAWPPDELPGNALRPTTGILRLRFTPPGDVR